ncbi:MAG: pitrilysin family protein [Planctomycetota bacterium]
MNDPSRRPALFATFRRPFPVAAIVALLVSLPGGPPAAAVSPGDGDKDLTPPTETAYAVLQDRPDRLIVELPNRLIVAAQRVPLQPVVSVQAWTKTGSIYEQEYTGAGLSHFLEHLISGGTTSTTPEADSNDILQRIGAQTNAATSLDTVRYYINTTADHTDDAIDRVSDWMQNSTIPQAEYDRERDVIQREFDMGQGDPGRIFWKLTQQARFTAHPARHPTIGYLDEFMDVSRDEIVDFYHRMYPPNNVVFVVAGDIDPKAVVDRVAELWADAQPRELPEVSLPIEPALTEPVNVTGSADVQRTRLRMVFPGVKLGAEHDYALDLLSAVLGQGQSSRLVQDLRDERGWVTSIDAYNWSASWGEGFFGVDAELTDDFQPLDGMDAASVEEARIASVAKVVHDQLERVKTEPVTQAELDRVKRQVKSRIAQSGQSAASVASSLARDIISTRDPDYSQKYLAAIDGITPADLMAAADAVIDFNQQITVVLNPLSEDGEVTTMDRDDDVDPATLPAERVDLDNAALVGDLRAALAKADADAETIATDGPVRFTLDNGLRVILQRSTVVPAVAIDLYWVGGLLADTPGQEGVANATATMLTRGFAGRTNADIAAQVESLGASLGSGGGNNTSFIQAGALAEDLDTVLGLVADAATAPDFPADEWDRLRSRLVAAIESRGDRWNTEVGDHFRRAYYGGTTWETAPSGEAEVVAALTPDQLKAFHFATLDPRQAVLAVVGDIDPAALRETIARRFGALAGSATIDVAPSPTHDAARLVVHPTEKPLAAVVIGLGPGITRDDPDYVPLQVLSNMLSAFPSGFLQQALRGEGPGLVYASGGYMTTGLRDGNYNILFNTSAEQAPEALRRVIAVVDRVKAGDFDDAQIAGAKARFLNDELAGKQSNAARATNLALDELYGVSDSGGQALLDRVQAVTADDLRRVAEAHLNDPIVVAISQDPLDEAAMREIIGLAEEPVAAGVSAATD